MKCPRCGNVELVPSTVEGVEIDRCLTCNGIWLDMHELERIIAADPRPLLKNDSIFPRAAAGAVDAKLNCPRCVSVPLIKLNSRVNPGTILDSCQVCFGLWLDAGELSHVARTGLSGRLKNIFS